MALRILRTFIKSSLPKSKFAHHVLTMMTGSGIAQIIPIIASPIITRLFTPGDFGEFALFFSWVSIISVVATGRYDLATVLPREDKDAVNIVALAAVIALYVSAILFAFVYFYETEISGLSENNNVSVWLHYVPVTILIVGLYNTTDNWAIRKTEYRLLAISRVLRNSVYVGVAILWGLTDLPGQGLIVGHIFGFAVALLVLSVLFYRNIKSIDGGLSNLSWQKIIQVSREYNKFPKYMIVSRLLEVVATELSVIMITAFYGSTVAGGYAFAKRMMQLPVSLVARAIADVFKQRASQDYARDGECILIFQKTVKSLAFIGIIPFLVLAVISPVLFEVIFGRDWRLAGDFAQILTIMCCLQFIANPVSSLFMIAQKQQWDLGLQVYLIIGSASSLYVGYAWSGSAKLSILLFTAVFSVKYMMELYLSWRFAKGEFA